MKKILIMVLILLYFGVNAYAESLCSSLRELANSAITARQTGVEIEKMYQVVDILIPSGNERLKKVVMSVVDTAYSYPIYRDPLKKQIVVQKFTEQVYYMCIEEALSDSY